MRRSVLGDHQNHQDVVGTLKNMSCTDRDLDKHDEALKTFEEALDIYRRVLGENHPSVAKAVHIVGRGHT
jgi:hypothetical protein